MSATYKLFLIYKFGTYTEDNGSQTNTHTKYVCSKILIINMQKILNELSMIGLATTITLSMNQIGRVSLTTNKVRRVLLLLPQNNYANLSEDLTKDIVASKIILLTNVLPLGLQYKNKQQKSK